MKKRWQRSHQEPSEGRFFVESSRTLQSKQVCSPLNQTARRSYHLELAISNEFEGR
jgi:hypothetical protein